MMRRLLALLLLTLVGCGASHGGDENGDADTDIDADADAGGDSDTDGDGRPPCPEGDDLVIDNPCVGQDECATTSCVIAGGVCVEEQWICGDCDYCFFRRENFLHPDPSGWECDEERVSCVPRE